MNKTLAKLFRLPTETRDASVVAYQPPSPEVMEKVLLTGDLASLTPPQRLSYYESVCRALKLNPLTKPFEYITLNNKLTLYARKDCTDQLRRTYAISIRVKSREVIDGVFTVVARAEMPSGRDDESIGAVFLPTAGEAKSNAMMKAETKAKRRVTLSICGLGMFDESEMEASVSTDEDAKRRVDEATKNRLADREPESLSPVTEDNFNEVVCHIGKAEGNMLGKKVGEIHPNVLQWLDKHYGEGEGARWGHPPTDKDASLKKAVEIALRKLSE
jgi:hypothetical protein